MAAPKYTTEHRLRLIEWLAAGYSGNAIRHFCQAEGVDPPADNVLTYYRRRWARAIDTARQARVDSALNTGLACKEERVARLKTHADELEILKWVPDDKGRFWNEKAWRETLDDIARELGQRVQQVDVQSGGQPLPPIREIVVTLTDARSLAPD